MNDLFYIMVMTLFVVGAPVALIGVTLRRAHRERADARRLYREIVMEKLDVIKTALAMGFQRDEVIELDRRLERLVGSRQLRELLDRKQPETPIASGDLMNADLLAETEQIQQMLARPEQKQNDS